MYRLILICVLASAIASSAWAQGSFTLSGTVFDENNQPIVGASVYVKDKVGVGTTTGTDGRFRLSVSQYNVVSFSYLGYETQEITVTNTSQTEMNVVLQPSATAVDEVVVVGMGTQRRVSIGGAISTINPSQLEIPATNIVNTLGGRVPGIIAVQNSGEPGRNISEFWVRGIGTFGANSGALVLIDGMEGTLSQIDPADVESFSVLKDASATAVYGSRGANGVVIVTTKRGLEQKLNITTRNNFTVSQLRRLPKYLRAYEYADLANEAAVATGMAPIYDDIALDIIRYGLDPDLYPDIDWQKEILNPVSFQHTHYVSAQGGGAVARYFASLGMSQETSAYKQSDDSKYNKGVGYNTYNYRLNLDINLTKTTQVYIGTTGFMSVSHRPSMGEEYARGKASITDRIWESQAKTTPLMYPLRYSSGELPASGSESDTPPHVLLNYTGATKEESTRNLINIGITQDLSMITKGLTLKILGSWDNQSLFGESRYKMPELYYASERSTTGQLKLVQRVQETAIDYSEASWTWKKLYFDANMNYDRVFGDHRVGGLLFYYLESQTESGAGSSMAAIPKRYQSVSGRLTYGFRDTYFLGLNFGLNGSENFKPGHQYGFFPAGEIAWVPTGYDFMKDLGWLNFLKFRFSYGTVGNDRISDRRFPYLTIIEENDGTNPWGGVGSLTEGQVGADNLRWEKAKKADVGMDVHLFNNKFTFTVDYFEDKREGIYQERKQIPHFAGLINMPYGNVGSMKSWGSDGNFEFFQKMGRETYLTLRGNYTLSKNKILNWEESDQIYGYLSQNGYAHNVQRGLVALGLFKDQEDVDKSPTQYGTVRPGDIKYKDVNGDGVINDDDRVPLFAYNGIPQLMYGFGGELRYKNFTLNIMFRGTGRNKFLYGGSNAGNFDGYIPFSKGFSGNVLTIAYDQKNRWTSADYSGDPATENPNARFPRLYYGTNSNNARPSTFWQGDARYLRLQEIGLTYSLRSAGLQRVIGIQSMDLQFIVENLKVWDSVKLFDPEQANSTGQAYPIPRRFSLQLYLNF